MRSLLTALAAATLSSCVGVGTYVGTTSHSNALSHNRYSYADQKWMVTAADFLKGWGEPEQKQALADGGEEWIYDTGELGWRGIVLWAGLPIPLMIPVGHNRIRVTFGPDASFSGGVWEAADEHFYGCFLWKCGHLLPWLF